MKIWPQGQIFYTQPNNKSPLFLTSTAVDDSHEERKEDFVFKKLLIG